MGETKLSSLIIFAICSTINENLESINYFYTMNNDKFKNITNNKKVVKTKNIIKDIKKDLFK